MTVKLSSSLKVSVLAVATAMALSACGESLEVTLVNPPSHGGGDDHDHDHGHDHDRSGRLVMTSFDDDHAYVLDLHDEAIIADFHLNNPAARIYSSPGYRYAVAIERADGVVSFIDSGLETEAHGDHDHHHEHEPSLLDFKLYGELPTHYDWFETRGAVFFDGVPGVAAKVAALSDHSLSEGRILADLHLARNQHGAAEIRGNDLFVSYRSVDVEGVLPDFVEVYERHSDHFDFVQRFQEPCPSLHGSATTSVYVTFGCADGVLVVTENESGFAAHKLANSEQIEAAGSRIGTLYAHDNTQNFVGRAGQELYWLHLDDGDMHHIDWRGEDNAESQIRAAGFNYSGNRFAILDDTGHLTVVRFRADHYEIQSVVKVLDSVGSQAPAIAFSATSHDAFITDPLAQEVIIFDLHDGVVEERIALEFAPAAVSWHGFLSESGHHH
ncbi:MAG: hypothetical protein LAT77_08960 [Aliidiomarina sp.]|uniref:hypothetical protein n=1 Tax=Aliidiomarina sp. TaxID=1872439 RepID=UPI0025C6D6DE|nr:hypothetical protein [Aliidiomarina sp.]MCH8502024.1 hypothetical protein [Aliidiomarina sp.]